MQKDIFIGDVQSGDHDGQKVELKGWINRTRGSNKIRFIVLRDSTGRIQCVAKRETVGDETFESLKSALIESSVIVRGTVNVDEKEGGHELVVDSAEVIGPVSLKVHSQSRKAQWRMVMEGKLNSTRSSPPLPTNLTNDEYAEDPFLCFWSDTWLLPGPRFY